jgi:hypothetical protein
VKTIDALNLLEAFRQVLSEPAITNDEKVSIGKELLRQLPHEDLFVSSQATLNAVRRFINTSVDGLEPKIDDGQREPTGTPREAKGTTARKSKAQAG